MKEVILNIQSNSRNHPQEISTIAKGAGIAFIGTIIGTGLKYFFELAVARNLGPKLFGVFFLGFTIFKILERISTFGLQNGVLRYVSLFRGVGDKERIKGTIFQSIKIVLIVGTLITAFIIIFSNNISVNIFHENNLSTILRIFALGVIFTAATEIFVYSTLAFQTTKYKVLVRMIFEPGARIFLVILAFILGWKLFGAVFAFGVSVIFGTCLAFIYLIKLFPEIKEKRLQPIYETRKILDFSWPLFFVGFFNLMIYHINTLMLGHFGSSQEVGVYGAAYRTAFLIPIILESFNSIFAPMISDLYNKKEFKKLENLFKIVTKWIIIVSLPIFLFIVFYSRQILRLWGKDYVIGSICLIILCAGQLINCSVGPAGYVITMIGKSKINLANATGIIIVNILLNIILIPKYGIIGAAISAAISLILINIIRLIEVFLILNIHPYRNDFLKPIVAGGFSIFILYLISLVLRINHYLLSLFIGSLIFFISYSASLYFLGFEEEDKVVFQKIREKVLYYITSR